MKILFRFLAVLAVLNCLSASADLVLYRGSAKETFVGQGGTAQFKFGLALIVDHDTANVAYLEFGAVNGQLIYFSGTLTNMHFVTVTSAPGKTSTVVARPPTECDLAEGFDSESIFAKGDNSLLLINTNTATTILFARSFTSTGRSLDTSDDPMLFERTFTAAFDKVQTPANNGSGATLEDVLAKLSTDVESRGYVKTGSRKKIADAARQIH
jgi:hypothetical protein